MTDQTTGSPHAKDSARTAREAGTRAAGSARDAASKIKETAKEQIGHVSDSALAHTEEQIDRAADGLGATAERLRKAANELEPQDAWIGVGLSRAAKGFDQASDYMSGRSLNHIVDDAQRFARSNPAAFLGAGAAVGFLLARAGAVANARLNEETDSDRAADTAYAAHNNMAGGY